IVYWAMSAVIVVFVIFVERRPLSSIGLTMPRVSSLLYGLLGGAVAFGGVALLYVFVLPKLGPDYAAKVGAVTASPFALRAEVVLRAAVLEELFYRGFMIERLAEILRVRWVAALISLVAFVAAHVGYWGWESILIAGWGGLVLTALYLWRRDLVANMLAHALTDGVALLT
ncbi:MAG TPA: CPBP family intramembrane glutamic endopeptidase, partial [Candidatus Aquilonibacter sp.]